MSNKRRYAAIDRENKAKRDGGEVALKAVAERTDINVHTVYRVWQAPNGSDI